MSSERAAISGATAGRRHPPGHCRATFVVVQSEIPVPADAAELIALAETALARAGQPSQDGLFLAESERIAAERSAW